ncbi:CHAT domain-containing protein [Asanoa siamensis]|uniref:CHAT domain-containing protein n=1 Tax=Asanoa siamensis TaxID=926357 RepID=A0ABQ4D1W6_9ACTN|nr:CHAT domain-containing protein [Asanoa siamensis]GIF77258.1 hypothetical protein Asi02nite_67760 [Asanoa siamensis]
MPGGSDQFGHDVDRRMALAREWDELVEQVRAIEGFEDFLQPPRLETLLPAAKGGPVIIVNVSRWRCDALIVTPGGVDVVELPELRQDTVVDQVQAYLDAVTTRQVATLRGTRRDMDATVSSDTVEAALDRCLQWMWDAFAERILDRLEHNKGGGRRIWWCPTGPLTLLPIHAAGYHRSPGRSVLDRAVSSYTPTLRALVAARAEPREQGGAPGRMLFVGMPDTPGQAPLPNVDTERDLLHERFDGACTELIGERATRDAVLAGLVNHRWAHFACHGEQDLADPSRGGVLVHDGQLTVADLSSQQYQGEFAFLSGCKTAVGGANLPDEAITLAAALHYTGYRHVIATLWSVWDDEAAEVADNVYGAIVRDGVLHADEAAAALHHATRALRDRHRNAPSVWTPFTHTGP